MGGQHEKVHNVSKQAPSKTFAPARARAPASASASFQMHPVRYHEKNGVIHFHDDIAKLRVAVPVAEFWEGWNRHRPSICERNRRLTFIDEKAGTVVVISGRLENHVVKVDIEVKSVSVDPSFADLNDFAYKIK